MKTRKLKLKVIKRFFDALSSKNRFRSKFRKYGICDCQVFVRRCNKFLDNDYYWIKYKERDKFSAFKKLNDGTIEQIYYDEVKIICGKIVWIEFGLGHDNHCHLYIASFADTSRVKIEFDYNLLLDIEYRKLTKSEVKTLTKLYWENLG